MNNLTLAMIAKKHYDNQFRYMLCCVAKMKNVNFFIFTPDDIDYDRKKIRGRYNINDEWKIKEFDYPDYIYDNLHARGSRKYKKVYEEFKNIPFNKTRNSIPSNKFYNYNIIKNSGEFTEYLIPFIELKDKESFYELLESYSKLIVKSFRGAGGSNVTLFEKIESNKYKIHFKHHQFYSDKTDLDRYLDTNFIEKESRFIAQPFINSTTITGNPFDIRVHLMRGINGNFEIAKIFPRIGSSQGIVSNIAEGGSTCDIWTFLNKHLALSNPKKKLQEIKDDSINFTNHFQKLYPHILDAIGLDVAIDEKGKLWIFEVNVNRFSAAPIQFESAKYIISYGIYKCTHKEREFYYEGTK